MRGKLVRKTTELILASSSKTRSRLLQNAGLNFTICPADVDEAAIKEKSVAIPVQSLAHILAAEKARQVSSVHSDALVIGADQILQCQGLLFDKPEGQGGVRDHLMKLRGKTHKLISTVCVAERGEIVWSETDSADLTMWNFSDQFIDQYVKSAGQSVQASVGAYRLEDIGVQLFKRINGDYFTILGLPLLPLLEFLRGRDSLES